VPELDRIDDVFVLDLGDTENRFHPDWLTSVEEHLAVVEQAEGPRALVTTATGKFFSNGLDLDWLGGHGDQTAAYIARVQELFARVLALPVVTVAALQGHTFAAGMSALIQARLTPQAAHEAMITGRRYGGGDALAVGIVDQVADEDRVRESALGLARPHVAKAGHNLAAIKVGMYGPVLDALRSPDPVLG
jgi:enoyl-CoA hydratase/carnithine racemase